VFDLQVLNNFLRAFVILIIGMLLLARFSQAEGVSNLPDPTQPARYQGKSQADSYRLESILKSPNRRVAIINGKALAVGDSIGDAKLRSIMNNAVTLQFPNKTIQLKLRENAVIKEVSAR
jgi:MSHA biogenesis protein MshK